MSDDKSTDLVLYDWKCLGCAEHGTDVARADSAGSVPQTVQCPNCAAQVLAVPSSLVRWNSKRRAYQVELTLPAQLEGQDSAQLAAWLPPQIAQRSHCECGATLRLKDHEVYLDNGEARFKGTFVCPACNGGTRGALKTLGNAIRAFWFSIKKVKGGPGGFEFETRAPFEDRNATE